MVARPLIRGRVKVRTLPPCCWVPKKQTPYQDNLMLPVETKSASRWIGFRTRIEFDRETVKAIPWHIGTRPGRIPHVDSLSKNSRLTKSLGATWHVTPVTGLQGTHSRPSPSTCPSTARKSIEEFRSRDQSPDHKGVIVHEANQPADHRRRGLFD